MKRKSSISLLLARYILAISISEFHLEKRGGRNLDLSFALTTTAESRNDLHNPIAQDPGEKTAYDRAGRHFCFFPPECKATIESPTRTTISGDNNTGDRRILCLLQLAAHERQIWPQLTRNDRSNYVYRRIDWRMRTLDPDPPKTFIRGP